MPIYSNNRTGSMVESTVKGYTCNDFGRIIYESQLNDMAFFEAALNCDFNEIKGLREGTLLEAEVKEENKKSFKAFLASIKTRILKTFEKIKQAISDFINRLASYALGSGVKFKDNFNNTVKKSIGNINNWNGSIKDVQYIDISDKNKILTFKRFEDFSQIKNYLANNRGGGALKKHLLFDNATPAEYNDAVRKTIKTMTLNNSKVNDLLDAVANSKSDIAYLKSLEKRTDNYARTLNKEIESLKDTDNVSVEDINRFCTDVESAYSIITRTKIGAIKFNTKSYRAALNRVLTDIHKDSKKDMMDYSKTESAMMLEFDYYMTCANPINESNRAQVKALIESC